MERCENCKKPIEFVGVLWIPSYGPLRNFSLRFDTVACSKEYQDKYSKYSEEMVGYESQCTNIKGE